MPTITTNVFNTDINDINLDELEKIIKDFIDKIDQTNNPIKLFNNSSNIDYLLTDDVFITKFWNFTKSINPLIINFVKELININNEILINNEKLFNSILKSYEESSTDIATSGNRELFNNIVKNNKKSFNDLIKSSKESLNKMLEGNNALSNEMSNRNYFFNKNITGKSIYFFEYLIQLRQILLLLQVVKFLSNQSKQYINNKRIFLFVMEYFIIVRKIFYYKYNSKPFNKEKLKLISNIEKSLIQTFYVINRYKIPEYDRFILLFSKDPMYKLTGDIDSNSDAEDYVYRNLPLDITEAEQQYTNLYDDDCFNISDNLNKLYYPIAEQNRSRFEEDLNKIEYIGYITNNKNNIKLLDAISYYSNHYIYNDINCLVDIKNILYDYINGTVKEPIKKLDLLNVTYQDKLSDGHKLDIIEIQSNIKDFMQGKSNALTFDEILENIKKLYQKIVPSIDQQYLHHKQNIKEKAKDIKGKDNEIVKLYKNYKLDFKKLEQYYKWNKYINTHLQSLSPKDGFYQNLVKVIFGNLLIRRLKDYEDNSKLYDLFKQVNKSEHKLMEKIDINSANDLSFDYLLHRNESDNLPQVTNFNDLSNSEIIEVSSSENKSITDLDTNRDPTKAPLNVEIENDVSTANKYDNEISITSQRLEKGESSGTKISIEEVKKDKIEEFDKSKYRLTTIDDLKLEEQWKKIFPGESFNIKAQEENKNQIDDILTTDQSKKEIRNNNVNAFISNRYIRESISECIKKKTTKGMLITPKGEAKRRGKAISRLDSSKNFQNLSFFSFVRFNR